MYIHITHPHYDYHLSSSICLFIPVLFMLRVVLLLLARSCLLSLSSVGTPHEHANSVTLRAFKRHALKHIIFLVVTVIREEDLFLY